MHERDLIKSIASRVARPHSQLKKGIGDDCAIFGSIPGSDWLVTADMLVEKIHFDTAWHDPYLLGRKSLAVNISDIAAMGGTPQFALLSMGIPGSFDSEWIDLYMDGFISFLDEYGCVLIGGDTVSSEVLTFSITVLGAAECGKAIGRQGAGPGDSVYVSGPLGSAAAGLYLCQKGELTVPEVKTANWQALLARHLDPVPRVELGRMLLQSGCVTAMQDISDGIATDLSHICAASGVRAVLDEFMLPAHPELKSMCIEMGLNVADFQLRGGEDYELLFTVRKDCEQQLEQQIISALGESVYRVGVLEEGEGVSMRAHSGESVRIDYQGYEHSS
jgi:thiamine-monophosphate kinase